MRPVRAVLVGVAVAALLAPFAAAPAGAASRTGPDLAELVGEGPAGRGSGPFGGTHLVPGELLVTTRTPGEAAALRRADGTVQALAARVVQVRVVPGQEGARAQQLRRAPGVMAVERAQYRRALAVPEDPLYRQQWAHGLTGVQSAWDTTTGSSAVRVAVVDTGVDARHADLGNVVEQRRFAGGTGTVVARGTDNSQCAGGHGTKVAGVVGADGNDGTGVVGVAWQVGLVDLSVFSETGRGCLSSETDILAAVRYAVATDVDVINLSLGAPSANESCSTASQAVFDEARAAGVLVVAGAGNGELESESAGRPVFPASCNGVVSVGAVNVDGERSPYSSTNIYVDLVAPGGDETQDFSDGVLSPAPDDKYDWVAGTSIAAPYVSGVAALLRAADPAVTVDEMEAALEGTANDLDVSGRDTQTGWGLVDAGAAVSAAALRTYPALQPDPVTPVSDDAGGSVEPPPDADAEVFRLDAGTAMTSAVTQAVAVSQAAFDDDGARYAVLARVDDFADALSGSSLGLGFAPLLFTGRTGALVAPTREELQRALPAGGRVYLLGGPAALPTTLEPQLRDAGFEPVRLEGQTREATAVAVAVELDRFREALGLGPAEVALLARSNDWADAVSGGSIGSYYGLPILLTPTASLAAATRDRLGTTRPSTILPLGGPAALAESTVTAAASAAGGADVVRLAGTDRYGTAVEVASLFQRLLAAGDVSPFCVLGVNLVRSDGFVHVLAASLLSGAYGCVMVPVQGAAGERLPTVTRDYVRGLGIDGVLVGGTDLVSNAAAADLRALLRGEA